jgi:hypothetical protein
VFIDKLPNSFGDSYTWYISATLVIDTTISCARDMELEMSW